jgi:hypothetical protein
MPHADNGAPAAQEAAKPKLKLHQEIGNLLKDFNKTYSNIQLYSWDHPTTQANIQQNVDSFKRVIEDSGHFSISLQDKKFMFEANSIETTSAGIIRLGRRLTEIGLISLSFTEELIFSDMEKLFRIITSTEQEIGEAGGIDMLAQREKMRGIKVNSSYYKLVQENEEVVDASMIGGGGGDTTLAGIIDPSQKPREMMERIVSNPTDFCDRLLETVTQVNQSLSGSELSNMMSSLVRNIETTTRQAGGAPILRAAPMRKKQVVHSYALLEVNLKREAGRHKGTSVGAVLAQVADTMAETTSSARADAVVSEFTETGGDEKRTKDMLKAVSPNQKTDEEILPKVKENVKENPEQTGGLLDLVEKHIEERKEKARKRRKPGLLERIRKKIEDDFRVEPGIDPLMAYLEHAVKNELQAELDKTMAAHEKTLDQKNRILTVFNRVFMELKMGLVILGKDETVLETVNVQALPLLVKVGQPLLPEVTDVLRRLEAGEVATCENVLISNVLKTEDNRIESFVVSSSPPEA